MPSCMFLFQYTLSVKEENILHKRDGEQQFCVTSHHGTLLAAAADLRNECHCTAQLPESQCLGIQLIYKDTTGLDLCEPE